MKYICTLVYFILQNEKQNSGDNLECLFILT